METTAQTTPKLVATWVTRTATDGSDVLEMRWHRPLTVDELTIENTPAAA